MKARAEDAQNSWKEAHRTGPREMGHKGQARLSLQGMFPGGLLKSFACCALLGAPGLAVPCRPLPEPGDPPRRRRPPLSARSLRGRRAGTHLAAAGSCLPLSGSCVCTQCPARPASAPGRPSGCSRSRPPAAPAGSPPGTPPRRCRSANAPPGCRCIWPRAAPAAFRCRSSTRT